METLAIVLSSNYVEGLTTKSLMKNAIHNHVEYHVHHLIEAKRLSRQLLGETITHKPH